MKCWLGVVVVTACSSPDPKAPQVTQPLPMCSGQTQDAQPAATTPRTGEMTLQLAPSLFERMAGCSEHDAMPPPQLALASVGTVNAKGDCAWANGVSCHFHLGAEFVDASKPRPNVGELHCIFPTAAPKSPLVYGTHFTCRSGSEVSREMKAREGRACGANLLSTLAATMSRCDPRCCDAGTLTDPTDERREAGTLDIRPNFRMCSASTELDCSAFAGMKGREANAPIFGPPINDGLSEWQ